MQRARELSATTMHHRNLVMIAIHKIDDRSRAFLHEFAVVERSASDFYDDSQFRPSRSSNPHITFRFWTAWPAAPFIRLSRHETMTARLPSALRLNPTSQKFVCSE